MSSIYRLEDGSIERTGLKTRHDNARCSPVLPVGIVVRHAGSIGATYSGRKGYSGGAPNFGSISVLSDPPGRRIV
jgi:hypothetical protein